MPLTTMSHRAWSQSKPASIAHMTWGGQWGNAVANNFDAPFQKLTGVEVIQERSSNPADRVTKLKLNLSNQIYDIVSLADSTAPLATAQGVLEELDFSSPRMPNLRRIPGRFRRKDWVAFCYSALGLAYNRANVKVPPTGFADLWDKRFKNRLVIPEISHSVGPYIIPIGAIAAGKDPKDAEAGFEMLKRLVELNPIWAKDTDTLISSLVNGEADISLLYKAQAFTAKDRGADVDWAYPREGALPYMSGCGIAKNTKNLELSESYINLVCDPQVQSWTTRMFNYPGTHPDEISTLPPNLQERAQFTPDHISRLVNLDLDYMADRRGEWTDRWTRIVSSR